MRRTRDLGQGHRLVGRAANLVLAICQLDVLRRGLQQRGTDALGLVLDLAGRLRDRFAPDRDRARAIRAPAPRALVGVAVEDGHVLRIEPQQVAGNLREARIETLAVGRSAAVDDRRARGSHANVRRFEERRLQPDALRPNRPRGRKAADLDVGREAHTAVHPLGAQTLLLAPECIEIEVRQQLVERSVVVARVVDDPDRGLVGKLILGDEVLAPQLEPVHPELVGEPVHHQLDPVGRLRPPRPADGVGAHLVGEDAGDAEVDDGELVTAAHDREAERRDERGEQQLVRAEVGDDPGATAGDRAVALGGQRHVVHLIAPVMARGHVLRARLGPLDRPPEALGEGEHERFLGVDLQLGAETSAHVGCDHPQLVLGYADHAREHEARDVRDLRGGVEREVVAARLGNAAARLDGRA